MQWHDDPLPTFWSELIRDLRDEVWRLKGATVARSEDQFPMLTPSEDDGTREAMFLSLQTQLREKNAEIAGIRAKFSQCTVSFHYICAWLSCRQDIKLVSCFSCSQVVMDQVVMDQVVMDQ